MSLALFESEPDSLEVVGTLRANDTGWVIDAEPWVMQRARRLFRSHVPAGKGERTHDRIQVSKTADNAKDLDWFMHRFALVVPSEVRFEVDRYVERYDACARAARLGDSNLSFDLTPEALPMGEPARPHQVGFRNLLQSVFRTLLGDDIGLGKTISAICSLCEPDARPALIVVPTHLPEQWQRQLWRFLPGASSHIIKKTKPYPLQKVDVVITTYTRVANWQDAFAQYGFKSVILDECQSLRHTGTEKRRVCRSVCDMAEYSFGLSATPMYNYGSEIWSVIDAIAPGSLGTEADFRREWCMGGDIVKDPVALNSYLKARGLFLRRTRSDLGLPETGTTRDVITIEGDIESLREVQDVAKKLAMSVLSNRIGESEMSARELDWRLRQATGVAKAKPVAEFVKMLCEDGEKVVLCGWHREVYEIWLKELVTLRPVMYTGSESPNQKIQSVQAFVNDPYRKVFILSNRSGEGLDGLQKACRTVVIGELDWSPQVIDQIIGRLDREGQSRHVNAYFPVIDDGADPFMLETLAVKRDQSEGIVDGVQGKVQILTDEEQENRIRAMAQAYLAMLGEAIPDAVPQSGLHHEVATVLSRLRIPTTTEREMQEAVFSVLPGLLPDCNVEREVRVTERSRLDFLVSRGDYRIAVECKIGSTGRAAVYAQVRRYAKEAGVTGVVILAPWSGVANFVVEEIPVTVVDWSKRKL